MASPLCSSFAPFLSVKSSCQRFVNGKKRSERDYSEQCVDLQLCLLCTLLGHSTSPPSPYPQSAIYTPVCFLTDHYSLLLQDPVKEPKKVRYG